MTSIANVVKYNVNMTSQQVLNDTDDKIESGDISVFDIESDKTFRLMILYLTIGINVVGTTLVVAYMFCNRRSRPRFTMSRVNAFILNLTVADSLVILLAVLPQLIWEYVDREWCAGLIMCRIVKFLQSFAIMSSNYILIVIAIDRHRAVRSPLKGSVSTRRSYVWTMAGIGWGMAALLSLPVFGMYEINVRNGQTYCESILRDKPPLHRQIWMTYIAVVVFFIPLVVLIVCYTRIFMKIAGKVSQNNMRSKTAHVTQCTQSYSLPKAKTKTLKMTFVIIAVFIFCTLPFFTVEMIMSFGNFRTLAPKLYALLGGMAAFNSAMNPFVFLAFNIKLNNLHECCNDTRRFRRSTRTFSFPATGSSGLSSMQSIRRTHIYKQETKYSLCEMRPLRENVSDQVDMKNGIDMV